jgi:hypothetical protein
VTQYLWSEAREQAVRLFRGDLPRPETEQAVLSVFQREPRRVVEAIEHVGRQVERGGIHSGWAVLRAHLRQLSTGAAEVAASDEDERQHRIGLAEEWIRTAGLHFDRRSEVEDELFGERGRLRPYAGDQVLCLRLVGLWERERPSGERVEHEAAERLRRHGETRRLAQAVARAGRPQGLAPCDWLAVGGAEGQGGKGPGEPGRA